MCCMLGTIEEKAEDYLKSTMVGSSFIKKCAYMQGAKDILAEFEMTISVSEEGWLKSNLEKLIKQLKGNDVNDIQE